MGSDGATNRETLLRAGAWLAGSGRSVGLFPKASSIAALQVAKAWLGARRGSSRLPSAPKRSADPFPSHPGKRGRVLQSGLLRSTFPPESGKRGIGCRATNSSQVSRLTSAPCILAVSAAEKGKGERKGSEEIPCAFARAG